MQRILFLSPLACIAFLFSVALITIIALITIPFALIFGFRPRRLLPVDLNNKTDRPDGDWFISYIPEVRITPNGKTFPFPVLLLVALLTGTAIYGMYALFTYVQGTLVVTLWVLGGAATIVGLWFICACLVMVAEKKPEAWRLVKAWWRARKQRICPIITFVDDGQPSEPDDSGADEPENIPERSA